MRRGFWKKFRWLNRSPLTVVELIIGISALVGGVYVLSPLVHLATILSGATPLVATLGNTVFLYIFGTMYTLAGAGTIYGIYKRNYRIRAISLFVNILVRVYGFTLGLLISGFLPITWLPSLTIISIAIVCYLVVRGFQARQINSEVKKSDVTST